MLFPTFGLFYATVRSLFLLRLLSRGGPKARLPRDFFDHLNFEHLNLFRLPASPELAIKAGRCFGSEISELGVGPPPCV
jgi:hypothetical protein